MSIKLGVVGAGIYGKYHILTYKSLKKVEKLVICDMNKDRLENAKKEFGVEGYLSIKEMINNEKLDAVAICTPDPYHYEPLKDCIEHGIKHILCEKPITTSLSEDRKSVV